MNDTLPVAQAAGLRAAVIGTGRMGVRHIQALRQLGMDVAALADVSADAVAAAAQEYEVPSSGCFQDAALMLRTVRPEAVVVSTTAPTHAPFVIAAAEAGARYVLCEKPMATSLAEARAMRSACERAGTKLAVNHQMRFMPQYVEVKALIEASGTLGPLASILVAGSNFGLAMNASHYFEMFRYVTGTAVDSVQAWFDEGDVPNPRGPQFHDRSGRVLARNREGVAMFIDFSGAAGHGLQVVYICRSGQVVVDELSGDLRVTARKAEFRELPTTRYAMPADVHSRAIEGADTVTPTMKVWSAILEGRPFPDGEAGEHALSCLVAAHISNDTRSAVRIDELDAARERRFPWA